MLLAKYCNKIISKNSDDILHQHANAIPFAVCYIKSKKSQHKNLGNYNGSKIYINSVCSMTTGVDNKKRKKFFAVKLH